jgi:hypothetical protein
MMEAGVGSPCSISVIPAPQDDASSRVCTTSKRRRAGRDSARQPPSGRDGEQEHCSDDGHDDAGQELQPRYERLSSTALESRKAEGAINQETEHRPCPPPSRLTPAWMTKPVDGERQVPRSDSEQAGARMEIPGASAATTAAAKPSWTRTAIWTSLVNRAGTQSPAARPFTPSGRAFVRRAGKET